jgi:aminoglycoside phosphotransferase (APT) family kinase protein
VREQFPELDASHVERLGEGWDNEAYVVDDEWIFRFPRHTEQVPWVEREIALMPVVSDALGPLAPRFEKLGEPSEPFPYPFVGYRRIEGVGADTTELRDSAGLARDIADAYTRIHAIDPSLISRTPDGWEDESWHDWRAQDPEDIDDLREVLPPDLRDRADPFITGDVEPPALVVGKRVVHNDICADHVLVDPATGRLTGLIDWADMMVGDPVLDFVGLIQVGRWDFVREVLSNYGGEIDDTFFERIVWAGRTLTLHWLVDLMDGTDVDPTVVDRGHILWVIRAFEEPS